MRILIATDAWVPQVNGVVRTWQAVTEQLRRQGHAIAAIAPDQFRTVPCPTYPQIRLALVAGRTLARRVDDFAPDAVHIATEGPIGWAIWRLCRRRGWRFTTSFHTKFPEYVHARTRIPVRLGYRVLRGFHARSDSVLVATESIRRELAGHGFRNLTRWTRGVDTALFRPRPRAEWPAELQALPRPINLFVGRVAVEKNIAAFLDAPLEGSKVVVGEGPQRSALARRYDSARFVGQHEGEALVRYYAAAYVFVFPSRTDTLAWCCWRRWPLACRWRRTRCPAPWTLSAAPRSEISITTLPRPCAWHLPVTATRAVPMR